MTTTPRLVKSLTQVNTSDAPAPMSGGFDIQFDGQIAPLADGGYVVVWTDLSRTYNPEGAAIVAQRYDSLGNKVGGEVKISQFVSGDQGSPAIATLPNGTVAIAYDHVLAGQADLFVRIVDPSGASLSVVRTDTIDIGTTQTFRPSITAFADSSYVITYTVDTAGTGNDTDIVARVVSATGAVGGQFDIDNQTDNRDFSEVATLSNGNFAVVYRDEFNSGPTDIKYAVFSPAGTQVAGPLAFPGGNGPGGETEPDVAALRNGGFVIVWTDPDTDFGDVRASIFSNAGSLVVDNILVSTTTQSLQQQASVVALADGGFLVSWGDGFTGFVGAQRFDATGQKIGTEATVTNTPSDSPEAALLADGGRIAYALGDQSTGDADVTTSVWRARDVSTATVRAAFSGATTAGKSISGR